jgi:hypothetical protein
LAGRDIREPLERFLTDDIDLAILFLCSGAGACNTKNMKLKQRLEKHGHLHQQKKILVLVNMLSITFREDFNRIVLTAEVKHFIS